MMLSIVLPCYNPPVGWEETILQNYFEIAKAIAVPIELIVVNDGSSNSIKETSIQKLKDEINLFQFIDYKTNQGKGFALRKGVEKATGAYIIYTDVDFPYTAASLIHLYHLLQNGASIAIGIKDKHYYQHVPFARQVISKLLKKLVRLFLSIPISDTQCGLKGFNEKSKHVFLSTLINRYLFDLEFVYKCYKQLPNNKISILEIELKPDVVFRKMNYKVLFNELNNFIRIVLASKTQVNPNEL